MPENVKIGYLFLLPLGELHTQKYVLKGDDSSRSCWGVDENGRANWTHGRWTLGKNIFESPEQAVENAKAECDKKLKSLKNQIKRLEAIDFDQKPIAPSKAAGPK